MRGWIFVVFLTIQLSLSSSYYHVLLANDRRHPVYGSENTLSSHLRHRRSLTQPAEILSSLLEYEGSSGDGSDDETGEVQTFQFFMKNNDTINSARTTVSEMMPNDAILMDFSIHNEGKTYSYNNKLTRTVEEASVEFQNAVSSGLSAVMLGNVRTSLERCSDCRADESDPAEAVAAVINVAPGDILSVSLSYMMPKVPGKVVENVKEIYRTDTTIDLDESAKNFTAVIMSPNYPQDYPDGADLTWLINAPTNDMVISSKFISFSSEACCDHLYIYDGPTDTYPLIYVVSGEASQKTIITTRSSMLVKFQSDSLITAGGFALELHPVSRDILQEIQIDEDKEGQVNDTMIYFDSFGVIKTPDYPEFYPASSTFSWDIVVESSYTIDFEIIDFDISPGETLQVIDLNTEEVYIILDSDASIPRSFNVSSNELSLIFHSIDKVIPKRGLYCKYFSRQAEEITVLTSVDTEWQTISSPHYPHHYSSNEYLVWIVTVDDPTSLVRIEVVALSLERGYDFLVLYSGSSIDDNKRLATLSGANGKEVEYISRENSATIVFKSDRSITDTGFQLRFRDYAVNTNCSAVTDVIQGKASGLVKNLDYPSYSYYSNNCQWLISVKETKIINIFLERYSGSYTQITFYDGASKSDPVLWKSDVHSISSDDAVSATSSTNEMLIIISRTNSYNAVFAFRFQDLDPANYPTCNPDAVYTVAPGQIRSPSYPLYAADVDCRWLIQAPSDYQVLVTVMRYSVYSYTDNPIYFYNGNSTSDTVITNCRYCGSDGYWIRSTGSSMLIQAWINTKGKFKFRYEFVSGSTLLINQEMSFATSPSFPNEYPTDSYEVTQIEVSAGDIIFYFETFETEECCDVLNLYDGDSTSSQLMTSLRGDHQGFQSQTTGQYLTLEFISDGSITGAGFKMDYCSTTENCMYFNKHNSAYSYQRLPYTDYSYYLATPNSSGFYPSLTDFYWYLDCPNVTNQIRYTFNRFDLDYTDTLTVYVGFEKNEDNIALRWANGASYYVDGYSVNVQAARNLIWFHTDAAFSGMGFYLEYRCDA